MLQANSLSDKDIALDLLIGSKATINSLAKTLTETTNSLLRETLRNQLTASVSSHYRLSDIAISRGWYNAYAEPQEQLKQDLAIAKDMTGNQKMYI
jgi:similar to spore coat protein